MKANELRIGNWVLSDPYGIPSRITRANFISDDFDYLEPIPLTPEILEKCGFIRTSINNPFFNMASLTISREMEISVHNAGTPNEMIFLSETDGQRSVVVIRNFDYDGKTYVHQLQNLYFALTGEELEINL